MLFRSYQGHAGDTLAAALLANDVHLVGRSFKYHRPRGILTAGVDEPNALVRLGRGAYAEPNLRATQIELFDGLYAESQNRMPSLKFDIGSVNSLLSRFFPAGFYYKTFMWPASLWMTYEHVIRHAAGLSDSLTERDTFQVALKIVSPVVIDAGQFVGVPFPVDADQIAAVGTAIDDDLNLSLQIP